MRIDPDTCRDPYLLAAEVRRLQGVIAAGEDAITDEERAPRTYRKTDGRRPILDMSGDWIPVTERLQPTLTDEEREALRHAEEATAGMLHVYTDERPGFDISENLRGLRERLG
jgi:hypothetical protein